MKYADKSQKRATMRFNSLKKAEDFAEKVKSKVIICKEKDSKYKVHYRPLKDVFNPKNK